MLLCADSALVILILISSQNELALSHRWAWCSQSWWAYLVLSTLAPPSTAEPMLGRPAAVSKKLGAAFSMGACRSKIKCTHKTVLIDLPGGGMLVCDANRNLQKNRWTRERALRFPPQTEMFLAKMLRLWSALARRATSANDFNRGCTRVLAHRGPDRQSSHAMALGCADLQLFSRRRSQDRQHPQWTHSKTA